MVKRADKPRFSSTDHLSAEAVAAFVDNELGHSARRRAMDHIAQCQECHEEIVAQRGAAERVRSCGADGVRAPDFLVERLARLSEADIAAGVGATDEHVPRSPRSFAQNLLNRVVSVLRAVKRKH
ncbi:hypothetical protein [Corynebacterium glaucum]|uniref:hypothetical protein n=1 Tax=Corynebacterium glaucum TaxID=187491 RepID=UPI0025B5CD8E|nr:hypothetical protein [Corynebacterium glaucum]WJZ07468.1 Anti-sigma-E factor RseA [Corynebacterium glaucum]